MDECLQMISILWIKIPIFTSLWNELWTTSTPLLKWLKGTQLKDLHTYVLDIVQISGSRNLFVAKGRFLKILENAYISKYVIQEIHLLSLNLELKVIL